MTPRRLCIQADAEATMTERELMNAKILTRRQIVNDIEKVGDRVKSKKDGSVWEFLGRDKSRPKSPNTYRRVE